MSNPTDSITTVTAWIIVIAVVLILLLCPSLLVLALLPAPAG
jgi:hypothetical protein